jgi:hypothetical protein
MAAGLGETASPGGAAEEPADGDVDGAPVAGADGVALGDGEAPVDGVALGVEPVSGTTAPDIAGSLDM